ANITVQYDDDGSGNILWAAKWWTTRDKRVRVNLFYPDRIERYVSKSQTEVIVSDARSFVPSPMSQAPSQGGDNGPGTLDLGPGTIANPYGVVPIFHFANNADVGDCGRSELEAAIPIQDGLNKSVLDMLVAMEFSAYRQRWAAGIEIDFDREGKKLAPFKA